MNNPYQVPMMNNPYMQPQNPYMDRMNFLQNYQQNLQQPLVPTSMSGANQQAMPQQIAGINGRIVQAVENINANEVPMDGSVAFFPKQDLTEIYAKSWNADGTIRTLTFKPVLNDKADILSGDTEKLEFDLSEKATEGIMAKLNELSEKIESLNKDNELVKIALTCPGVGPLTASAIVAEVGDASQFRNGREMAAWNGVVPSQHSTGGRSTLGGITKTGNRYCRLS